MRTFEQTISKGKKQCQVCGLIVGNCLCSEKIDIQSNVEFWLLTHEEELKRTNNTGRLIEYAVGNTKVFRWHRTEEPKALIKLIQSEAYHIYIIFSDDRASEKVRVKPYQITDKPTVFLIIDGTWKEARKILRKSPYLDKLPILTLAPTKSTSYNLRRNSEQHHLCTVEVAISLFELVGEQSQALQLEEYYQKFLLKYHEGKYNYGE